MPITVSDASIPHSQDPPNAADEFARMLRRDGVIRHPDARLTPLSGGVSSDIYRVDDGPGRTFVVKRALPRLRVADEWTADVSRNANERRYIEYLDRAVPGAAPKLLAYSDEAGYFAMEWLSEHDLELLKAKLMAGRCDLPDALAAGHVLGAVHAASARDPAIPSQFATGAGFHQLRVEPYLLTTGRRHPQLRDTFDREAARLAATHEALVHGDYSPKNLLVSDRRLVVLDCEVAWFGDPAFDVAFFLSHVMLKGLHHAPQVGTLPEFAEAFLRAYHEARDLPHASAATESRLTTLLPMLLLARVDGKSPVEYLAGREARRGLLRHFVYEALSSPPADVRALLADWFSRVISVKPEVN